jgi:lipoprotein NlpI
MNHPLAGLFAAFLTSATLLDLPPFQAGQADMVKGDFDAALVDFTHSIDTDSKKPEPYNARGFARLHQLDLAGAIADFNQAIELNKRFANAYFGRALAEQMKGGLDAALDDYTHCIALSPGKSWNPHFYLWLCRTQLNQKDDADKELAAFMAANGTVPDSAWDVTIGGFLLGHVSEDDFFKQLAANTTTDDTTKATCEALYFAGMKRLIAGDKIEAIDHFRKALATNQTRLTQYPLAQAEFQALTH